MVAKIELCEEDLDKVTDGIEDSELESYAKNQAVTMVCPLCVANPIILKKAFRNHLVNRHGYSLEYLNSLFFEEFFAVLI